MVRLENQDYKNAKEHIYDLANSVCVNKQEQQIMLRCLKEIEKHSLICGESNKRVIQLMLSCIYDGLAFGNWPWIRNGINILEYK